VLVGSDELVTRAHRLRKMLGGGMRQAGILAAAALHALDHHVDRLADDHAAARGFAEHLRASPLASRGRVAVELPETNIVMVDLDIAAEPVVRALAARGVRLSAFGPKRLRAVTHLDVPLDACVEAARAVLEVVGSIEPSEASKP
jgi:threonine aldolase